MFDSVKYLFETCQNCFKLTFLFNLIKNPSGAGNELGFLPPSACLADTTMSPQKLALWQDRISAILYISYLYYIDTEQSTCMSNKKTKTVMLSIGYPKSILKCDLKSVIHYRLGWLQYARTQCCDQYAAPLPIPTRIRRERVCYARRQLFRCVYL